MWRTTSKPLFIFSFLSFLSGCPSFSSAMQLEKALSSKREKESKRKRKSRKKQKDGDDIGMIICEQVTSLLAPLCLLSNQAVYMEAILLQIPCKEKKRVSHC